MYMQAAFDRFAKLDQAKVGQIVMEIALLGRNGLEINKPAVRYTLQNRKRSTNPILPRLATL